MSVGRRFLRALADGVRAFWIDTRLMLRYARVLSIYFAGVALVWLLQSRVAIPLILRGIESGDRLILASSILVLNSSTALLGHFGMLIIFTIGVQVARERCTSLRLPDCSFWGRLERSQKARVAFAVLFTGLLIPVMGLNAARMLGMGEVEFTMIARIMYQAVASGFGFFEIVGVILVAASAGFSRQSWRLAGVATGLAMLALAAHMEAGLILTITNV